MRTPRTSAGARALRVTVPVLLVALALGAAGCTSIRSGRDLSADRIRPEESTKLEVIDALGAPDVLRNRGEDQILTYRCARGTGFGLGAGVSRFNLLTLEHLQIGRDTLNVVVGPDGKVRYFYLSRQSNRTRMRLWPFGD